MKTLTKSIRTSLTTIALIIASTSIYATPVIPNLALAPMVSDPNSLSTTVNAKSPINQHAIKRNTFELVCPYAPGNVGTYAAVSVNDNFLSPDAAVGVSVAKDDNIFYRDSQVNGIGRTVINNSGVGRYFVTVQLTNTGTVTAVPMNYTANFGCYDLNTNLTVPGIVVSPIFP